MLQTVLTNEAAQRVRQGQSFVRREDVVSCRGTAEGGEPAQLLSEDGTVLGVGDVDLDASVAVRRIGLPSERPEGVIPRQLRRAAERRMGLVMDARFSRMVNDEGDGLPGLVIDRYDAHYALQTFSRPMDARVGEIAHALAEVAGARSVILRNDTWRRTAAKLPRAKRQHVLLGTPPRWTRIQELGARITVDLHAGVETGYRYEMREVRRIISQLSSQLRVLELSCHVGGRLVHAGRGGARQIVAFDSDANAVELTRENIELNGLLGKAHVELASPAEALEQVHSRFDLVLLDIPNDYLADAEATVGLLRRAIGATRQGGRLLVSCAPPACDPEQLPMLLAESVKRESRVAFSLLRMGSPGDFPSLLGACETFTAVCVELG